jgi:hypothetical protein
MRHTHSICRSICTWYMRFIQYVIRTCSDQVRPRVLCTANSRNAYGLCGDLRACLMKSGWATLVRSHGEANEETLECVPAVAAAAAAQPGPHAAAPALALGRRAGAPRRARGRGGPGTSRTPRAGVDSSPRQHVGRLRARSAQAHAYVGSEPAAGLRLPARAHAARGPRAVPPLPHVVRSTMPGRPRSCCGRSGSWCPVRRTRACTSARPRASCPASHGARPRRACDTSVRSAPSTTGGATGYCVHKWRAAYGVRRAGPGSLWPYASVTRATCVCVCVWRSVSG